MLRISPYNLNINFQSKAKNNKTITHTNPNGDKFEISYKDGRLDKSYKNGELYKSYQYEGDFRDDITCEFFNDDSYIPIKHLWHVDNADVKSVINHENSTEHFFLRNDKNGMENEPKLFAHIMLDSKNKIEKRNIVKFNDIEEVRFSSVEEAQDYFLEEYGIDAEFNDIFQATIFKQAVDSFVPLNYENKGKRLFEGLKVRNDEDAFKKDSSVYASVYCDFLVGLPDGLKTKSESRQLNYIKKHPDVVTAEEPVLLLNPHKEYTSTTFYTGYKTKYHPFQFFSSIITHELGHWLHLKNSPADFYITAAEKNSPKDKLFGRKVSRYAAEKKAEFVAEYTSGRLEGNYYSSRTDKFFQHLGGPKLFKD